MLNKVQCHLKNKLPFLDKSKLLIAVSGGIDSVVLAYLCHKLGLNIALAHCNFNLRGKESDADESFVLKLAEDLNAECFIECFDTLTYAQENKLSTQMAARELRYKWFNELAQQLQYDYILTAHHADDNLETFLINLSRGTGIEGLTGIPEINENIVRPLLPFSRDEIEKYAKLENLKWREDSSNASAKYLRNKLRLDVIPQLKEVSQQFLPNFNKTLEYLKGSKDIIDDRIDDISNQVIQNVDTNGVKFNISEINKLSAPNPYLYELLKEYGFTEWSDVYGLLEAQSGKHILSKTHQLLKDRDCLILTEIASKKRKTFTILEYKSKFEIPIGTLFFDEADALFGKRLDTIFVDREKLVFPLIIRKYVEGDVFYPFGMKGKKKLSKYFKDEKMSLIDKKNVWLLCSQNNVVWVINRRLDNRFSVTENTKEIIKITFKQ